MDIGQAGPTARLPAAARALGWGILRLPLPRCRGNLLERSRGEAVAGFPWRRWAEGLPHGLPFGAAAQGLWLCAEPALPPPAAAVLPHTPYPLSCTVFPLLLRSEPCQGGSGRKAACTICQAWSRGRARAGPAQRSLGHRAPGGVERGPPARWVL